MTKPWLADRFDRSGTIALLLALRRRRSPWLPIFTFHRVHVRGTSTPFDDDAYDVDLEQLERIAATIREQFEPLGIPELLHFADGRGLPRHPIVVTFDGGYRDNYEAARVLLRHGVPATFFVPVDAVTHRRMPYRDALNYLVKMSPRDRIAIGYPEPCELDLASPQARAHAIAKLVGCARSAGVDVERLVEHVARACGVAWTRDLERGFAAEHVLTWDHVRELRGAGMHVQPLAPTRRVGADDVASWTAAFETTIGERPLCVAYDGTDVREHLANGGYRLGMTTRTGAQPANGIIDPLALRRIGVDLDTAPALARAALAAPSRAA